MKKLVFLCWVAVAAVACGGAEDGAGGNWKHELGRHEPSPVEPSWPAGATIESLYGSYSSEEVELISLAVLGMGLDAQKTEYIGGELVVEDDVTIDPAYLLEPGEDGVSPAEWLAQSYTSQLLEKGFAKGGLVPTLGRPIRIEFGGAVPEDWREAFYTAAGQWGEVPNGCILFTFSKRVNTQNVISIIMDSGLDNDVMARASFPRARRQFGNTRTFLLPGGKLRINPLGNNANAARKLKTALHELGHMLGFTHPGEGAHLRTTSRSNYSTVMRQGAIGGLVAGSLTTDDRRSRLMKFPLLDANAPTSTRKCQCVTELPFPRPGGCAPRPKPVIRRGRFGPR